MFADKLYKTRQCYILTYNFKKVVKSIVDIKKRDNNQVVLQPIIKNIKIEEKKK